MEWQPSCPDLNPIENLWTFEKMKLYEDGTQYNNKADLLKAIKTTILESEPAEVKKKIAKTKDNKLLAVIEKKSYYIKM